MAHPGLGHSTPEEAALYARVFHYLGTAASVAAFLFFWFCVIAIVLAFV